MANAMALVGTVAIQEVTAPTKKTNKIIPIAQTLRTYIASRLHSLQQHPAWWRMKLLWFHSIMLVKYVWTLLMEYGIQIIFPMAFMTMKPLMPLLLMMAYIVGVWIGISGELVQEILIFILRYRFYKEDTELPAVFPTWITVGCDVTPRNRKLNIFTRAGESQNVQSFYVKLHM